MNQKINIAIYGAAGRMGQVLLQATQLNPRTQVSAAFEYATHPHLGQDAGVTVGLPPLNVPLSTNFAEDFEVLIDFTRPVPSLVALDFCVKHRKGLVIGTTGFTPEEKARIDAAAQQIPIVMAANFSVGVNVLRKLVFQAAQTLGESFDIEIVEAHHRHKVDAPSGTALALGEAAAAGVARHLRDVAIYGREGHTGARDPQTIGFATVRGGDVVGDHTVMFMADGERVELTHKASSRLTFANGAVRAAAWLQGRAAGWYDMQAVLGL